MKWYRVRIEYRYTLKGIAFGDVERCTIDVKAKNEEQAIRYARVQLVDDITCEIISTSATEINELQVIYGICRF